MNKNKIPLSFGVYKGKTPEEIYEIAPSYLIWLYENVRPNLVTRRLYVTCCEEISADDDLFWDDNLIYGRGD